MHAPREILSAERRGPVVSPFMLLPLSIGPYRAEFWRRCAPRARWFERQATPDASSIRGRLCAPRVNRASIARPGQSAAAGPDRSVVAMVTIGLGESLCEESSSAVGDGQRSRTTRPARDRRCSGAATGRQAVPAVTLTDVAWPTAPAHPSECEAPCRRNPRRPGGARVDRRLRRVACATRASLSRRSSPAWCFSARPSAGKV